jgi:hypothetical protein
MQWSKSPFVMKGKQVTLFLLIQVSKMMQKIVSSISEALQLFIGKKMVGEIWIESNKKAKPFSVVQVANRKLEGYYIQRTIRIYWGSNFNGAKSREKRVHLDDMWTSCKQCLQPFSGTAMSRNRYKSVFQFIRLDDAEKKQNRISATKNKLEAIHSNFYQFSLTCTENYSSGCNLNTDEG